MGLLSSLAQIVRPGVERWDVKTGTDAAALTIPMTPIPSTIAALIALPAPSRPTVRTAAECVIYSVPAMIVMWKIETDGDFHIRAVDELGNSFVCEIPDPDFVGPSSPWLAQIAAARARFQIGAAINVPVLLTGVCFFDKIHGVVGAAPSGVELHPLLRIDLQADVATSSLA